MMAARGVTLLALLALPVCVVCVVTLDMGVSRIGSGSCPVCHYTVPITVAGKSFDVVCDTGSTDLALILSSCTKCSQISTLFPIPQLTCDAATGCTFVPCAQYNAVSNPHMCLNGLGAAEFSSYCETNYEKVADSAAACVSHLQDYDHNLFATCTTFGVPNSCGVVSLYGVSASLHGWRALVSQVDVSLADTVVSQATFGGIMEIVSTDGFGENAAGIMGMAYSPLSVMGAQPLVQQLAAARGSDYQDVFAMCYGATSGKLVLGGVNSSLYVGTFRALPLTQETYYRVTLLGVAVGEHSSTYTFPAPQEAVFDSGSPLTFLEYSLFQKIGETLKASCPGVSQTTQPDGSYIFSGQCSTVPQITLVFDGGFATSYSIPMWRWWNPEQGTSNFQSAESQNFNILGVPFQQSYFMVFDRAASTVKLAYVNEAACNVSNSFVPVPASSAGFADIPITSVWWFWVAVGSGVLVLLLGVTAAVCHRRRQHRRETEMKNVV